MEATPVKNNMKLKIIYLIFLLIVDINLVTAEPAIHTVENKFKAVFPSPPKLLGIFGSGKHKSRGFVSADNSNLVVYRAAIGTGSYNFKKSDIVSAIDNYIRGEAVGQNAVITHKDIGMIGKNYGAYYTLKLKYKGVPARIFASVIFHKNKFITWGIQDIPSMSKSDASTLFNAYAKYFQPL